MLSNLDSKFKLFTRGFTLPLRALETVFNHPRLLLLSLLPVVVTLFLIAVIIYACLAGAWAQGMNLFQNTLGAQTWMVNSIIVAIVAILIIYFLFHALTILISLISSPFNDVLASATEEVLGSHLTPLTFADLIRVFFLDLQKTFLTLFLAAGLALFSFVPLFGLLSVLGFALLHTLTFVTYPQSRRKLGLLGSLSWISHHWEASLGFGLMSLFLFGIPVINLFLLPLSVVGGTLLFLENEKSEPPVEALAVRSDSLLKF